jgi:hypothetical protein
LIYNINKYEFIRLNQSIFVGSKNLEHVHPLQKPQSPEDLIDTSIYSEKIVDAIEFYRIET